MSVSSKVTVCDIDKIVETVAAHEVSSDDDLGLACGHQHPDKLPVLSDISDIECTQPETRPLATRSPQIEGCKKRLTFQPADSGFTSTSRTLKRLNLIPQSVPKLSHKRLKRERKQKTLMDLPLVPAQTQVTSKEKEERDVFMAKMKSMMMISWQVLCQNPGLQSLLNLDGITCDPIWCTTQCGIVTQKSVTNWLNYSRPGIGPQCIPSSVLGTTLSKDSATYTLSTTADGPVGNAIAAGTRGINDLTLTAGLLARARSRLPTGRRCSHICYGLRRVLQIRVGAHSWRYPARLTCVSDASDRNRLSYRARSQTGLFTQCTDVWNS